MSLNLFLIQLVIFTSVLLLFQASRIARGWLAVAGILLLVLGIGVLTVPDCAGFISGGLWGVLILVPLLGSAQITRLVYQERYGVAQTLASIVRWFHPVDGFWEYPDLLRGLKRGQVGDLEGAVQIFSRYQASSTPSGRMAMVLLYRMGAQWPEFLAWAENEVPEPVLFKELLLATTYVRSLGEMGDLNHLVQAAERFEHLLGRRGNLQQINLIRLYAFAFCGYTWQVRRLLEGPLSVYPETTRQFWLTTAELAAGKNAETQQRLLTLRDRADQPLRHAIDWRLSHPTPSPDQVLTLASRQLLNQFEKALSQEARYSSRVLLLSRKSYATYALVGANLLMFALETASGGSEDLYVLYRLGALVPEAVFAGEWWRTITATFLHSGMLHLTANMLGLYVFGGLVEAALGSRKFLMCYAFSGVGSMLTVAILANLTGSLGQITVGASGAVMGILGAEGAIQLKGWRQEKARVARDRLRLISVVIVLQIISDLLTPQVSLVGHLSGLILGFIAGTVLFKARPN